MKVLALAAAIATLTSSVAGFAHGGGKHFMGTIRAVEAGAITVATKEKKDVTIGVDAATKYEKAGRAASPADLVVGERVVVHTAKSEKLGAPKAILVKFGAAPKAPLGRHETHVEHGSPAAGASDKKL